MWASSRDNAVAQLFVAGRWQCGGGGALLDVIDPGAGRKVGALALADEDDCARALESARNAFEHWKRVLPAERSALLRAAAAELRAAKEEIATDVVIEMGKTLAEARAEVAFAADVLEWCADRALDATGRLVSGRVPGMRHTVLREPMGVAVLVPTWNVPVLFAARKLGECLAAGCTAVLLGSPQAPSAACAVVRAFERAGMPQGVINLLFGRLPEVSRVLLADPAVRKLSFTGSATTARLLANQLHDPAVSTTFELGGHAPAIVFDDVDVPSVAAALVSAKFRNAGQVCNSPTRFFVQRAVYDEFVEAFVQGAERLQVGHGLEPGSQMGSLAGPRRVHAMQDLMQDALAHHARVRTGGRAFGGEGAFFLPTVIEHLDPACRLLIEEPFGPVACMLPFDDPADMLVQANALPFGLAGYAFTRDADRLRLIERELEVGLLGLNTCTIAVPETPFGGIKQSGQGVEGGAEGVAQYQWTRTVTEFSPLAS